MLQSFLGSKILPRLPGLPRRGKRFQKNSARCWQLVCLTGCLSFLSYFTAVFDLNWGYMLAMLEFYSSHKVLYDSKLRPTRNRIDEMIDASKIKPHNTSMWYPDGHRIQYMVVFAS